MRYETKLTVLFAGLALLSSCGSDNGEKAPESLPAPQEGAVSDTPIKLGAPYTVGNATYKPEDVAGYDEVGYASWYGQELSGRPTANGERFNPMAITAAHKTLPMPSYVEVTALDTGKTILVRINDRGPFANDRLIDLSEGAARQLGITSQGSTGVRVRRVNPPEQEKSVLRSGNAAPSRLETPESLLKILREKLMKLPKPSGAVAIAPRPTAPQPGRPAPVASGNDGRFVREGGGTTVSRPAPAPRPVAAPVASGSFVVQIGSFSSRAHADQLARKAGAKVFVSSDGRLYRVRFGPFATTAEAEKSLGDARRKGYTQAKLVRE
ncbi:MAG: septal ring lytic transglycosylase RlpA family protein [Sphingomonadales bacterium]|jgi:rare lipoprotein A|nr:septal ring lytic transglycosylase RlpA family protein [Sphingomonadales bacterium]MBK9431706.1 septal ring lytic transglycosylase RlpA family protein [Sphingomonadales bacterium]